MDAAFVRTRLEDDLRSVFQGSLLLDDVSRQLYSTDASLFQVEPLAVAVPRTESDVSQLLHYCYEHNIPVTARGAGTGLAGESLNIGVIVDLSVHFRQILDIQNDRVRVQPGVPLRLLNQQLATQGRRFAPDPASGATCTIGGMLANNASGGKAALLGTTRQYVESLRVVWDDGTAETIGDDTQLEQIRSLDILLGTRELISNSVAAVAASRVRSPFNRAGYALAEALSHERSRLLPLLVGSEGTLGIITEAVLRTIPLAGGRSGLAAAFVTLEAALEAARLVRPMLPAACEVMDRWLISLVRTQSPDAARTVPAEAEAVLMLEFEQESPRDARAILDQCIETLQVLQSKMLVCVPAYDGSSCDYLWTLRESALPSLYALGKGARPLAFVEDIGLPEEVIGTFVSDTQRILRDFDTRASFLIHAATGQVHVRPFLDVSREEDAAKLYPIADRIHSLAIEMGGCISSQHATGIARTPWVEKQAPGLYPIYRELKRIFDPKGILNPSKIVGPDPTRPAWPLRKVIVTEHDVATPPRVMPLLVWQPLEMERAVEACNGCGACRTERPSQRMCPTFRATHQEAAAPRAKANLLREILTSRTANPGDDAVREVADLCVNCRMCAVECPGKADIPKLMIEAKAAHHRDHGLSRSNWFLARIDSLSALGSIFSLTSNLLLKRKSVRFLLEKVFCLSRQRTLPHFAYRRYTKRIGRSLTRRTDLKSGDIGAVYFVDTYANSFDTSIAEATVAVLKHNGIVVHVPARQRGSGAPAFSMGDIDHARERLLANVRVLSESVRAGYTVVCSEPTAALFLRADALGLSSDPDVKLVADNTMELMAFLHQLHEQGRLKTDFQPLDLTLGHHIPCHIKALGAGRRTAEVLDLIPQLQINTIDLGCSGMAGIYGLNAENYALSLQIGQPMFEELARPRHLFGVSECSSCRLQMTEGTGKTVLHPVQYLAMAYGLMPEIAERLRKSIPVAEVK